MAITGSSPEPTTPVTTTYSTPSSSDLAAVAATVSVVGVLMALLIAWLVVRLRRSHSESSIPIVATSTASYTFRPSFAPSEASSKFGFIRKPLRLSRPHGDGSWDFADPDPFAQQKETPIGTPVPTLSQKHRPAPLSPTPAYTPRAHRAGAHKDESGPRTPSTPALVEPPPAYCRGPVS